MFRLAPPLLIQLLVWSFLCRQFEESSCICLNLVTVHQGGPAVRLDVLLTSCSLDRLLSSCSLAHVVIACDCIFKILNLVLHCSPPCAICLNLFNQSYSIITFHQLAQSCSICPIICIFNFRNIAIFNALFNLSQFPQLAQQFPFFVQVQMPLLFCSVRFSSLVHLSSILFIILCSSSSDIVASSCWVHVLLKFRF